MVLQHGASYLNRLCEWVQGIVLMASPLARGEVYFKSRCRVAHTIRPACSWKCRGVADVGRPPQGTLFLTVMLFCYLIGRYGGQLPIAVEHRPACSSTPATTCTDPDAGWVLETAELTVPMTLPF